MNLTPEEEDRLRRRVLFVPCESREHLQLWVKTYLGLDLPDCTVLEESNSNPMEFLWMTYDRLRRNDVEGFSRLMAYSSRGGFKTLNASVLETVCLLHLKRDVGHMAAVKEQSKIAAGYVKEFLWRPIIRDFIESENATQITVTRYQHKNTGDCIPRKEWSELVQSEKEMYTYVSNFVKIVVCTNAGTNGFHCNLGVFDELDVIPKNQIYAYNMAQSIPDSRGGVLPMIVLTSTRKSRIGLVQQEIDKASRTGLRIFHWNLMDVTERCTPDRHRPEMPQSTYYVNDNDVRHITAEEFGVLNPAEQNKFHAVGGFAGCRECILFPACQGRLATHQTSTSPLLKPVTDAIAKFKGATPEYITTEYLARKPDTTGLVYPRLNREIHMKTAAEIAEMITGDKPLKIDKAGLIQLLKDRGAAFGAGMDFGFTHNFAVATGASWGAYEFVLDGFAQAGLELDDKITACEYLKAVYGNPPIYGDPAYPSDIKTFRRRGYKMKEWQKGPGSVKAGIEIIRTMLYSGKGKVRLFFLADDPGVELLFKHLSDYHFTMDAGGQPTEVPDETNDDYCDALRYKIMNKFGSQGAVKENDIPTFAPKSGALPNPHLTPGTQQNWMQKAIRDAQGEAGTPEQEGEGNFHVKKGRFIFDV